ncbi:MAG: symporter small accessory protein [Methanoregula sp.]
MFLGIPDPQIIIGYGLAIGLTLACVVYGWLYWNSNGDDHGS